MNRTIMIIMKENRQKQSTKDGEQLPWSSLVCFLAQGFALLSLSVWLHHNACKTWIPMFDCLSGDSVFLVRLKFHLAVTWMVIYLYLNVIWILYEYCMNLTRRCHVKDLESYLKVPWSQSQPYLCSSIFPMRLAIPLNWLFFSDPLTNPYSIELGNDFKHKEYFSNRISVLLTFLSSFSFHFFLFCCS